MTDETRLKNVLQCMELIEAHTDQIFMRYRHAPTGEVINVSLDECPGKFAIQEAFRLIREYKDRPPV